MKTKKFVVVMCLLLSFICTSCTLAIPPSYISPSITGIPNEETKSEVTDEILLYTDEKVRVYYVNFTQTTGVTTFNLVLKIENNSDKKVFVSLIDGYVNDTLINFFTGLPVEILPNKKAVSAFGFGYANLGITNIKDVKKIEFKISFRDSDNFSEIVAETEVITINF